MAALGFVASDDHDLPDWAKFTPLPMGITKADKFIAVSPGYAREILTPEYGCGIDELVLNYTQTRSWES